MTSIFHYRLHFPHLAKYRNIAHFKRLTFNLHLYAFPCSAYHFPLRPPYLRNDVADIRGRPLYRFQIARSLEYRHDPDIRQTGRSKTPGSSRIDPGAVKIFGCFRGKPIFALSFNVCKFVPTAPGLSSDDEPGDF